MVRGRSECRKNLQEAKVHNMVRLFKKKEVKNWRGEGYTQGSHVITMANISFTKNRLLKVSVSRNQVNFQQWSGTQ